MSPSSKMAFLSLVAAGIVTTSGCSDDGGDAAPREEADAGLVGSLCTPGEATCRQGSSTEVLVCNAGGTGYDLVVCPSGEICVPEKHACSPRLCEAGTQRCRSDGVREVCGIGGGSWNPDPCPAPMVCSTATNTCLTPVCNTGEVTCSSDFASIAKCSPDRTRYDREPCPDDKVCAGTACTLDALPLGDVTWVKSGGTVALTPGRYAVAVVDSALGGGSLTGVLTVENGSVHPPPASPTPRPPTQRRFTCGTPKRLGLDLAGLRVGVPRPPPAAAPSVGDRRTFNVPQESKELVPRTAVLAFSGTTVDVWVDESDRVWLDNSIARDVALAMDENIVGRVTAIYGTTTDVDLSGKIDMLLTSAFDNPNTAAFVWPVTLIPASAQFGADFGEIVYLRADLAGSLQYRPFLFATIAHELQHLVYFGIRYALFGVDDPYNVPPGVSEDAYAIEGIAETAAGWSGEAPYNYTPVYALESPGSFSLGSLFRSDYLADPETSIIAYGFGALAMEYLIEQAGGFTVEGLGAQITDKGGKQFIDAFTEASSGTGRLPPVSVWWPDLGVALLVSSMPGNASEAVAADPRYRFFPVTADPAGGNRGLSMTYLEIDGRVGPIVSRAVWDGKPLSMSRGGMSFLDFGVGEGGATIKAGSSYVSAAIIRYGNFEPGGR